MIALAKGREPAILVDNAVAWTETLISRFGAGKEPTTTERTRYRHRDIKRALVEELHGKCAYCESKLLHIHHGDAEHIVPKSLDFLRSFDWNNLTLACEICNQNKSDRDPEAEHILDPYQDDPSEHLTFVGALVLARGTDLGICSRRIFDLNRADLVERRKEKLEAVMNLLEMVLRLDLPTVARQAIYDNLKATETVASAQYSAMVLDALIDARRYLPHDIVA